MNKKQMLEKLNFHFPSYEAVDGVDFGDSDENTIFFLGESACANLINDTMVHYDDFGEYTINRSEGEGCPVTVFLNRHGWYVEQWDESLAYAVKDTFLESEWDRLIEKSKSQRLSYEEKARLKVLQVQAF